MSPKKIFLTAILLVAAGPAFAQTPPVPGKMDSPDVEAAQQPSKEPSLPPPVSALAQQGAQVRYLGRTHDLDGWITIKDGHTQYFYAPPDQSYLMMGLLFDPDGKLVTVRQIKALQDKAGHSLDAIAGGAPASPPPAAAPAGTPAAQPALSQFKTPSEQLYDNVQNANTITLGSNPNAPTLYAFIDPQCPHCQAFLKDAKPSLDAGQLQIKAIPIGFREDTVAQAAYLLAAPDAADRLYKYIQTGDKTVLPVTPGINEQGVERNLAIMQSWKFDVTPMIVYRSTSGQVKIIRGRPRNLGTVIADAKKKAS